MFEKEHKGCIDQGCSDKEVLEVYGVTVAVAGDATMNQVVTSLQQCMGKLY